MGNNYLSLKGYFVLLALALHLFNAKAQQTFNYTGAVQTVNLPAGSYSIAMWGADGGDAPYGTGGKGGYSQGTLTVNAPTTYYIYVGGKGSTSGTAGTPGGWNGGGGFIGSFSTGTVCGTGGGGTDIRTTSNTTYANRIIVAGGGGGGTGYLGFTGNGGNGGGTTGADGTSSRGQTYAGGGATAATGGTAATGSGIAAYYAAGAAGSFGVGGDYLGGLGGTAGGGGYYGGGSGHWGGAGGGGSGYVGGVTNGLTSQLSQPGFVAKPVVTGDGLVVITPLCNIGITTSSSLICTGNSVTLTTNAASNYTWSTGNTATTSIVVSPAATTTYSLNGTGTNPVGCTGSAVITITVNNTPTVTINSSTTSACLGQTVSLTANGANTYTWTGSTPTVTNGVAFTPAATTSYSVTGTNACGTASSAVTVTVSALPVLASASSTLVCASTAATLMAGGATTYTWMPGNSTQTNYIASPAANTVYTVTGKTGSCLGTNTIAITTKPNPTITISAPNATICEGGSAVLTASGAVTYTWNPLVSSNTMVTVSPTLSTLYTVVGTNAVNCKASASQVVLVNARPVVNASATDPVVCPGGSSTLTATGANTYLWDGTTAGAILVVNPTSTTTYSVAGTSTNSCSNETVITVSVFDPSLTVSSSTAVCRGINVSLSASGMDTYQWSTGSGFSSINVTPTTTTTYSVNTTSTQGAVTCSVNGVVTVSVNPNPTVTAVSNPTIICKGETAVITASGAATYTWSGSTPEVAASMTVTPAADQTYSVAGLDANGCKGAGTVLVRVAGCVGIADHSSNTVNISVYPNPSNGNITISSEQAISLQISNELGQVIKTITLNKTGETVNVSNLADGIYFITGQNANGSVKQKLVITK